MSFNFVSIEHKIAYVAQQAVIKAKAVAAVITQLGTKAESAETTIEALTGLVDPQAVVIERAAFSALGLIVKAAQDVEAVGSATLSIPVASQDIADFKALGQYIGSLFTANGITTPATK